MGLGFVTAAIGVPINGAIADRVGLQESLMSQVILVAVTLVIAWLLPRETEMETYSDLVPAVRPATAGATPVP
jgi:nitrate/nitrite transporter NarK